MNRNETDSLHNHSEKNLHPLFSIRKNEDQIEVSLKLLNKDEIKMKDFFIIHRETGKRETFDAVRLEDGSFAFCLSLYNLFADTAKEKTKEHIEFFFSLEIRDGENWHTEEYPLSLNLFQQFDSLGLSQSTIDGNTIIPYFSRRNDIFCLAVNVPIRSTRFIRDHTIEAISVSKESLKASGRLAVKAFTVNRIDVLTVGRRSGKETVIHTEHQFEHRDEHEKHLSYYTYDFSLSLQTFTREHFVKNKQDEDVDFYLTVYLNGLYSPTVIPLAHPSEPVPKNFYRDFGISYGRSTAVLSFYFTGIQQALTLAISVYEKEIYTEYRESAPASWLMHPLYEKRNFWVIGETPLTAKGNGWHFFRYMREEHPEIETYYVLDEQSPDFAKVAAIDPEAILIFKSKKYIQTLLAAKVILTTGEPYAIYPSRSPLAVEHIRAKHVLLGENVLGLNDLSQTIGYTEKTFRNDLLLVSSKTEERYVQQTLGYPEKMIRKTGLAKFDELLSDAPLDKIQRRLLILPENRWTGAFDPRDDLKQTAEAFLSLLNDADFQAFTATHHLEVVVALPTSLKQYETAFEETDVTLVQQDQEEMIDLFKTSLLLITDADARAFDFSFLEKPVLFYQPETDERRVTNEANVRHTYLNELPGEIAVTKDSLLHLLELLANDQFNMSRKNRQKMDALFEYRDAHSNERIFKAVQTFLS